VSFTRERDLLAGIVFVAIGAAALVLGADLTIGTAAEMGEGYVPRAMAVALVGFGVLIVAARARAAAPPSASPPVAGEDADGGTPHWRPVVFVTAAVLAFAAALQTLGLLAAIACSVTAANFAGRPLRAPHLAVLIVTLGFVVTAVFVWGLGLPLNLLPR
jgi:hypothetical protein